MIYHQDMQESIRREKILHNPDDRSRSVIGNVDNKISTQSNPGTFRTFKWIDQSIRRRQATKLTVTRTLKMRPQTAIF